MKECLTVRDSYTTLNVVKVNTYGLVFHWQGSDKSLPPILLAAHQGRALYGRRIHDASFTISCSDVVPVDPHTIDQWQYPPYSGYYDGQNLPTSKRTEHNLFARHLDLGSWKCG